MRHWIHTGCAAVALLAISLAAHASDVTKPVYKTPIPVAAAHNWTGCYLGGNVGGARAHTQLTSPFNGANDGTFNNKDVGGGVQAGCDYQFAGAWVVGLQGMYDWTGINETQLLAETTEIQEAIKFPWLATVTGRIGYAVHPSLLLYAKGGAAWTHFQQTEFALGVFNALASTARMGWTAGAGFEYNLLPNWSIFVEYNYLDFGKERVAFVQDSGTIFENINNHMQVVLIGLNYRFGVDRQPVTARY